MTFLLLKNFTSISQNGNFNYKHTIVPKNPVKTNVILNNPDIASEEITYFDGIGRPKQHILKGNTALKSDFVQPILYDDFGREAKKLLPYKAAQNNGEYIPSAESEQLLFYQTANGIAHSDFPYSMNVYEKSSQSRTVEVGREGGNSQPGGGHTKRISYRTNTITDNVLIWDYDYVNLRPFVKTITPVTPNGTTVCSTNFFNSSCNNNYNTSQLFNNTLFGQQNSLYAGPNDQNSFGFYFKQTTSIPNNSNYFETTFSTPGYYKISFSCRKLNQNSNVKIKVINKINNTVLYTLNAPTTTWNSYSFNYCTNGNMVNLRLEAFDGAWANSITSSDIVLIDDIYINNVSSGCISNSISSATPVYYPPSMLNALESLDENNNKSIEFKDLNGNIILKKKQVSPTLFTETYYVYNDEGLLASVVQPEAVRLLSSNGYSLTGANNLFNDYVFNYVYDERERQVINKLPGGNEIHTVYDLKDRVVFTQNSKQRQNQQWLLHKYDELDRLIYTCLVSSSNGRVTLQNAINNLGVINETTINSGIFYSYTPLANVSIIDTLSINYYNSYDLNNDGTDEWSILNHPSVNISNQTQRLFGLLTVTKNKLLNYSSKWATNVTYYDEEVKPIVVYEINPYGGSNVNINTYNFTGQLINNKLIHIVSNSNPLQTVIVQKRYEYDHTDRLKNTYITPPGMSELLMSQIVYNELGQANKKSIHVLNPGQFGMQDIEYTYHISGMMTDINNVDNLGNDLFAMRFHFDDAYTHNNSSTGTNGGQFSNTPLYNNMISAYEWRCKRDEALRGYIFKYDNSYRLIEANFYGTDKTNSSNENGKYEAKNIAYDNNGNLTTMDQYGLLSKPLRNVANSYGIIDKLTYSYSGNKLTQVGDAATTQNTGLNDFTDRNKSATTNDFVYDVNGNMVTDRNKQINIISYNYLDLPYILNWQNGDVMQTDYDASGKKWRTVYKCNNVIKNDYSYFGGIVYVDGTLDVIQHEEGRLVKNRQTNAPANTPYLYQYDHKDHQGNVRVTYMPEINTNGSWKCTYEAHDSYRKDLYPPQNSSSGTNNSLISSPVVLLDSEYDPSREVRKNNAYENEIPNPDDSNIVVIPEPIFFENVEKQEWQSYIAPVEDPNDPDRPRFMNWDEPIKSLEMHYEGLNSGKHFKERNLKTTLTIDVQKGDTIRAESMAYASDLPGDQKPPNDDWLLSIFGLDPGFYTPNTDGLPTYTGPQVTVNFFSVFMGLLDLLDLDKRQEIKGSLVIRLLDSSDNVVEVMADPITTLQTWDNLSTSIVVKNPLAVKAQIFVSARVSTPVYFDNIVVLQARVTPKIVQENHYYPYGLNIKGLEYIATNDTNHINLYNGKEIVMREYLEWNDYGARYYDPQIGRWHVSDPVTDKAQGWSPYRYGFDNPVNMIDPNGMFETEFKDSDGNITKTVNDGSNAVFQETGAGSDKHYEFKGYDEKQGGENKVNLTTAIQEQQNMNIDNPSLQQYANGPKDKSTHCNQATQNILKTVSSALKEPNFMEKGDANTMMGKYGFADNSLFKKVDYKTAKENAKKGGLSIGGLIESGHGHVLTFSVGENIKKGEVANLGGKKWSGFVSLNTAIDKTKTKTYYILLK